jgi:hypothetical protein
MNDGEVRSFKGLIKATPPTLRAVLSSDVPALTDTRQTCHCTLVSSMT